MKKISLILLLLHAGCASAQRSMQINFREKRGSQYLVVKYKGQRNDYFNPVSTDYFNPNQVKDTVRSVNESDLNISGILFFLSKEEDSMLYQVWDSNAINTAYFEQFNDHLFDYQKWTGFGKRNVKFVIPISVNPVIFDTCNRANYRIHVRGGLVGESIQWMEEEIDLGIK